MIGPLLVALVEAVELRDDDPRGNRREEQRVLLLSIQRVERTAASAQERLDERERKQQPEHVSREQHPPHEPTPSLDPRRLPAPLDDLERAVIDRRVHLIVERDAL